MPRRAGFSLLEVMIALAILTVSLAILIETQSTAAYATMEAERFITASDLARVKATEVMLLVEHEGFSQSETKDSGDFDDFGDEVLSREFGEELKDFHWEYWVSEIDIRFASDMAQMAAELQGTGLFGSGGAGDAPTDAAAGGMPGGMGAMSGLLNPQMLTEMIGPYIREVRVRVWWGKSSKEAEELGNEVVVVTHAINPSGQIATDAAGVGAGGAP